MNRLTQKYKAKLVKVLYVAANVLLVGKTLYLIAYHLDCGCIIGIFPFKSVTGNCRGQCRHRVLKL